MNQYDRLAYETSRHVTLRYSTSFGMSSRLFDARIKSHIYAIYALVRIADEIVDTYRGPDVAEVLNSLEQQVYAALASGYITDLIVHAFVLTARTYGITDVLLKPFFTSMRMDLSSQKYNDEMYRIYIHGSAEVIGLMCLRVFVENDQKQYEQLLTGASALGAAYQKVNFLRDIAADHAELKRWYFPNTSYETFDDAAKQSIIADIKNDFTVALPSLGNLPIGSRKATYMSYVYYSKLLERLEQTPAAVIKKQRIRLPSRRKFLLLLQTAAKNVAAQ